MDRQGPRVQWHKASIPSTACQLALITLIVLKLTGVITWSWWWVLSPLWIGGILLALAVCALPISLRWHARRRARLWMDQLGSEWFREFLAGKPDASGEEPGPRDGGGHGGGQGASPPGG
jgi:hypothetical protein